MQSIISKKMRRRGAFLFLAIVGGLWLLVSCRPEPPQPTPLPTPEATAEAVTATPTPTARPTMPAPASPTPRPTAVRMVAATEYTMWLPVVAKPEPVRGWAKAYSIRHI